MDQNFEDHVSNSEVKTVSDKLEYFEYSILSIEALFWASSHSYQEDFLLSRGVDLM